MNLINCRQWKCRCRLLALSGLRSPGA
jgi:hypothetical protein